MDAGGSPAINKRHKTGIVLGSRQERSICKSTAEFMTATEFLWVGLGGGAIQSAACSLFNSKHDQRLNWTVNLKMLHQGYQSDLDHYSCAVKTISPGELQSLLQRLSGWFIQTSSKFPPNAQESMTRRRRRRRPFVHSAINGRDGRLHIQ